MYRKLSRFSLRSAQLCALGLLLASPSFSQILDVPGQQQTGDYKLSGIVVNGVTGEPIRRALVQLFSTQSEPVLTDSEGKFEFNGLPEGRFQVTVRKPGYFNDQEMPAGSHQTTSVEIGPDTPATTLKLYPEAVIFGRVESNGEPVEDLPMKVMAIRINGGRKSWMRLAGVSTNADGDFRIPGLTPGTYYLSTGPHWERTDSGTMPFGKGFAEIFYDNADDVTSATPIQVSAGQQVEANFSVKSPSLFHISGTINVPPGQSANLMLLNWAGEPVELPTHFIPEKGEFQAVVPSGSYMLQAQSFGENSTPMNAMIPLHVMSNISGLRLVLAPAITIPVYVQKQNVTQPEIPRIPADSRGDFTMDRWDGSVTISLIPVDQSLQSRTFVSDYKMMGNTQQLQIENVDPGRYTASISAGGGEWYVQSARCGGVDLLHEDLTIAGSQPPPIDIVLRNDSAQIDVQVSSVDQDHQASVLIVPDGAPFMTREASASEGHFVMKGLAPGDYYVLAVDHAQNLEYTNPEVLGPYLPGAQRVSLQAGQKSEVNVELVKVEKP